MTSLKNAFDYLINNLIRNLPASTRVGISVLLFFAASIIFYYFIASIKTGKGAKEDSKVTAKFSLLVISFLLAGLSSVYMFII